MHPHPNIAHQPKIASCFRLVQQLGHPIPAASYPLPPLCPLSYFLDANTLSSLQNSHQFVYVILDGDGAIFREQLISEGYKGGTEAARKLNFSAS